MKTAFVFPGQGAQSIGMGKDFAESYLDRANTALGFDLKTICLKGPEQELKKTEITQPAIFTVSAAALDLLTKKGIKADAACGHSLGEYSALYCAGTLSFEDAVKVLNLRGKFMQQAVPFGQGSMAAVLNLSREKIEACCKKAESFGLVSPANFNTSGQIVISGKKEAVEEASRLCKEAGAKRVIPLAVSAPFHCPLMQPAANQLASELDKIKINDASIPVMANATATFVTKAEDIKNSLVKQVTAAVLWEESIKKLIADGFSRFVEVGPGNVLAGLIKKIDKTVEVKSYKEMI